VDFIAAIGNGGTLYRPQVIERIAPPDGDATYSLSPDVLGELPIGDENLAIIQEAMVSVVENSRGTARHVFANFPVNLAGKTGTAQDPPRDPHAWFGGYTFEGREDLPDIAGVVLLENAGEGSDWAAPVFKGILQLYFTGKRDPFPWETQVGVWETPEPEETETPEP
jgi:penicillin-binding protein 2